MLSISPRHKDGWENALEVAVRLTPAPLEAHQYPDSYVDFIETVLGITLTPKQREIVRAVERYRRIAVRSCHASGKTFIVAALIIAFLHLNPYSKVVTTGPSQDHVRDVMWQTVRQIAEAAPGPLIGKPGIVRWEIASGWYAIGLKPASTNPGRLQGHHAPKILLICDEAAETDTPILNSLESLMTGGGATMLWIGNPTFVGAPFFEAFHSASELWHGIKIAAVDTPNIQAGRIMIPGLIDQQYIDEQVALFGVDSDWVRSRVHGEFPRQQATAWVQLLWIDRCTTASKGFNTHRMVRRDASGSVLSVDPLDIGVDIARSGKDKNYACCRQGPHVWSWRSWSSDDTMATASLIKAFAREQRAEVARRLDVPPHVLPIRYVNIDLTGIGAGVFDRLRADKRDGTFEVGAVVGVNFGSRASDPEKWQNKRQEMWYGLRERFMQTRIVGQFDPTFVADVTGARFLGQTGYVSGRTMPHVEPKEDMQKRLKRSPDAGDAAALAFFLDPDAHSALSASTSPISVRAAVVPYYAELDDEDA